MHPFVEILRRKVKSPADKALCQAIAYISTREGFRHLSPVAVFDQLAKDWNQYTEKEENKCQTTRRPPSTRRGSARAQ